MSIIEIVWLQFCLSYYYILINRLKLGKPKIITQVKLLSLLTAKRQKIYKCSDVLLFNKYFDITFLCLCF